MKVSLTSEIYQRKEFGLEIEVNIIMCMLHAFECRKEHIRFFNQLCSGDCFNMIV